MSIPDYVNDFLKQPYEGYVRLPVKVGDDLVLSIQASSGHYCQPREDNAERYTHVEVGYPSHVVLELLAWAEQSGDPTETVYPYVPVDVLNAIIHAAGGFKDKTNG